MSKLVRGLGTKTFFLPDSSGPFLDAGAGRSEIVDVSPEDQTVTVGTGTRIDDLQHELARYGQTLPIPTDDWGALLRGVPGTVGGLIGANLPHALAAQCGGVKDWLLHAEVWFKGGPASSGAKVVKSVAGYDVHKLYVGSWGSLGPVLEATLRTWPIRALPKVEAVRHSEWGGGPFWAVRTLRSMFSTYEMGVGSILASDPASCTLWVDSEPPRPGEGWVLGPAGHRWPEPSAPRLTSRLKAVFDPEGEWR
ncbi:MAG: FAD-binding oxidoreductase [Armatimonadetes bacterium]|nr:FAD-binding oxidoreductase [Armatimonadota bacterium]